MFKKVAGKSEVYSAVVNHRQISDITDDSFNTGRYMSSKTRPRINGNPPAGYNVVDESTVAGSKIEHASVLGHPMAEKRMPKGMPKHVASGVRRKTGFVIPRIHARFHPNVSPRIMPRPTRRARMLSVFPPLLIPT